MDVLKTMKSITNRYDIPILLNVMNKPVICEVGVHIGHHLQNLVKADIDKAFGIDSWRSTGDLGQNDSDHSQDELDGFYYKVCKLFEGDQRVKIVREFSAEASKDFEDGFFDFIYLDADHTYDGIYTDLESWYPKLKIGGIISGHDYIDGDYTLSIGHLVRFDVIEAVADFRKKYNIDDEYFHVSGEQYASFFIYKK